MLVERIEKLLDIFVNVVCGLDDVGKIGSTMADISVRTAVVDLCPKQNGKTAIVNAIITA